MGAVAAGPVEAGPGVIVPTHNGGAGLIDIAAVLASFQREHSGSGIEEKVVVSF
ncbi:MAG: hypothetical protein RQ801_08485 [Spirochaetaceae bacterium]|nr:hypothetical protein [Spirochaetaceae bacterium]MDT8298320.1 hypothetical protein [Spirochaetaceae bacterium]